MFRIIEQIRILEIYRNFHGFRNYVLAASQKRQSSFCSRWRTNSMHLAAIGIPPLHNFQMQFHLQSLLFQAWHCREQLHLLWYIPIVLKSSCPMKWTLENRRILFFMWMTNRKPLCSSFLHKLFAIICGHFRFQRAESLLLTAKKQVEIPWHFKHFRWNFRKYWNGSLITKPFLKSWKTLLHRL